MNTPEEIKKLILQARSFTPVKLTAQPGVNINVQLGYGSVRATALTSVNGNGAGTTPVTVPTTGQIYPRAINI